MPGYGGGIAVCGERGGVIGVDEVSGKPGLDE